MFPYAAAFRSVSTPSALGGSDAMTRNVRGKSFICIHLCSSVVSSLLLLLSGCVRIDAPIGIELRAKTRFESEWKHYLELPTHKSLAVAGDPSGVYASGSTFGYGDRAAAVRDALNFCRERRADRRVTDECRTYAVDNRRVRADAQKRRGARGEGRATNAEQGAAAGNEAREPVP